MNKKAALIEISTSHDECLYSQLLFLKDSGYEVDFDLFFCAERQSVRNLFRSHNKFLQLW